MQQQASVPWGYIMYKGRIVPSFDEARKATIVQVFDWLGKMETVERVKGTNGSELKGWCPWGESHGKKDSFSINEATGRGMCHAGSCKRTCSHVVHFMSQYIETHPRDGLFTHLKYKGDQAAAEWIIEKLSEDNPAYEDDAEAVSTVPNFIIHDLDALVYGLRQLGLALRDEESLREIAEILARPH